MESSRYCQVCTCKSTCVGEFKKVIELKSSGLRIYIMKKKDTQTIGTPTFIVCNTSDKEVQRDDYVNELDQYKTKCLHCKSLFQRCRNLLDEISAIKKNQVLGICEYCKRANICGKCKRCEFIVNKFLTNKVQFIEDKQQRFNLWLHKVRGLLQSLLEESGTVCKCYQEKHYTSELDKLLEELKSPLFTHRPNIEYFPPIASDITSLESLSLCKQKVEKALSKFQNDFPNKNYGFEEASVADKTAKELEKLKDKTKDITDTFALKQPLSVTNDSKRQLRQGIVSKGRMEVTKDFKGNSKSVSSLMKESKRPLSRDKASKDPSSIIKESKTVLSQDKKFKSRYSVEKGRSSIEKESKIISSLDQVSKPSPSFDKMSTTATTIKKKIKDTSLLTKDMKSTSLSSERIESKLQDKENKTSNVKSKSEERSTCKKSSSEKMLMKLIKENEKLRNKRERESKRMKEEKQKMKQLTDILINLPIPKRRSKKVIVETVSESVVECSSGEPFRPKEMIKGNEIVNFDPNYKNVDSGSVKALQYKVQHIFELESKDFKDTSNIISEEKDKRHARLITDTSNVNKGIIKYDLSNKAFIEKGWTKLPTSKVMRRMNVYKMLPVNSNNWFVRHKNQILYYDSGEILAEIDENGYGKLYYKNGLVALDYYNVKDNAAERYIVYSTGEPYEYGKSRPLTVLAAFDYLGNGVVYDHYGNERLKYNQSEGIVIDAKIGPAAKWKWHILNDPPILQPIFIENKMKTDPCLEDFLRDQSHKETETTDLTQDSLQRISDEQMLAIELENIVKERRKKLHRNYKPFKIQPKFVKINEYFSLRVIEQSNIYLQFKNGSISLKVDLGMILKSDEIMDVDIADVKDISTSYDQYPPRSESIANIQRIIMRAKRVGKMQAPTLFPTVSNHNNSM